MTSTKFTFPETTTHLRRLESGLVVPATTGTRTFATQSAMFPGFFDPKFNKYKTNVPAEPTNPSSSELYEITRSARFVDLLGSFNTNIRSLFWRSEDQILTWAENHSKYIRLDGYATFFPFIVSGKFLVAVVDKHRGKLGANLDDYHTDLFMDIGHLDRFVFPKPIE